MDTEKKIVSPKARKYIIHCKKKERKITNKNVKSRSILLYLSSIKIPKLARAGKRGSILLHKVWSKRRRKCSVKRPEVLFSLCVIKRYFVNSNWYFSLILYVIYYLIWKPIQNGQGFTNIAFYFIDFDTVWILCIWMHGTSQPF